jgi:hypothetical protein
MARSVERPCTGWSGPSPCPGWQPGWASHRATWPVSARCSTYPGLSAAIGRSWRSAKRRSNRRSPNRVPETRSSGRATEPYRNGPGPYRGLPTSGLGGSARYGGSFRTGIHWSAEPSRSSRQVDSPGTASTSSRPKNCSSTSQSPRQSWTRLSRLRTNFSWPWRPGTIAWSSRPIRSNGTGRRSTSGRTPGKATIITICGHRCAAQWCTSAPWRSASPSSRCPRKRRPAT